ncbi:hypothetical protein TNCV_4365151 [Trichonephila clavipes]|nr:hypothetical protein TNCV_4365151 [Trichonephila clavipes]
MVIGYPRNRVSERCPIPINSDKRRSTGIEIFSISREIESKLIQGSKFGRRTATRYSTTTEMILTLPERALSAYA